MNALLALWSGPIGSWSIADWAITIVIIIAICALVMLYCRVAEVTIPPWVIQAAWIVLGCVIIIALIRFVATL